MGDINGPDAEVEPKPQKLVGDLPESCEEISAFVQNRYSDTKIDPNELADADIIDLLARARRVTRNQTQD